MKYSKTTIKELSQQYRLILKKCALLNAIIIIGAIPCAGQAGAVVENPASVQDSGSTINDTVHILSGYTWTIKDMGGEDNTKSFRNWRRPI